MIILDLGRLLARLLVFLIAGSAGLAAHATPFAYITNQNGNTVSVIDVATNSVVATVPVGTSPYGVAVNPNGTRIVVANSGSNNVSVMEPFTNTVLATIAVGLVPIGVAVDPEDNDFAYVANQNSNTVSVINLNSNTVIATIGVGSAPNGVAVDPTDTFVYVTNANSGNVSVIDVGALTVTATVPVGASPFGVAFSPSGTRAYVANYGSGSVSVVDTATRTVVATVTVGTNPVGVAVNPTGTRAYVSNIGSNNVSVIDTATNAVVATVAVGTQPSGVSLNPAGTSAYVANYGSNNVSVIDTATNNVTATVAVGLAPEAFGAFIGGAGLLRPPDVSFGYVTTSLVAVGQPATLRLQIQDNSGLGITGGTVAPLSYAAGIVNSPSPVLLNTCGGTLTAVPGAGNFSLAGAVVLPNSGCEIELSVTPTVAGSLVTTFGPGAFVGSTGANTGTDSATLLAVSPLVVSNALDAGPGSLRAAITASNASCPGSPFVITFNIPGPGPHAINPATELPPVMCQGIINGYSQPGAAPNTDPGGSNNAVIKVVLDGTGCAGCSGIVFGGAGGHTVQGLAIHSFPGDGIKVVNGVSYSSLVTGNYIGLDAGGMNVLGNGGAGVSLSGNSFVAVGDLTAAGQNVISGHANGVDVVNAYNAQVYGNIIGGLRNGAAGPGNGTGVRFRNGNQGGVNSSFIRYNTGAGVALEATHPGNIQIFNNSIHANGSIGIDLLDDGPTPNDEASPPYDADAGPNGLLNHPVITSVTQVAGDTVVAGYLKSQPPGQGFSIQLYHNGVPGLRQGEKVVADLGVVVDGAGYGTFSHTIVGFPADNVTAITIDGQNTSEFSPPVAALPAGAVASLSPSSIAFGAQLVGTTSASSSFTLTNTGTQPLNLLGIAVSGPFALGAAPAPCQAGAAIPPAGSCTYDAVFSPASNGNLAGAVTFTTDAPGSPHAVSLTGQGMSPPTFSVVTGSSVPAGGVTTASVRVGNPGSNPLAYSDIAFTLTYPAGFTNAAPNASYPQGGCGANFSYTGGVQGGNTIGSPGGGSANPGVTCSRAAAQIDVPLVPGSYTFSIPAGGITVAAPFPYSNPAPVTMTMTVTATGAPGLSLVPGALAFPPRTVSTTSPPQTVTLSNTGTALLTIASMTAIGDFAFTSGCAATVPAGGSCDIDVTFTPLAIGSRPGSVTIVSDAAGSPHSIALSGDGRAAPVPVIQVTPPVLDFAARQVGSESALQFATITNNGAAPLAFEAIAASGDFIATLAFVSATGPCAAALAPGASCEVGVAFRPSAAGVREGTLTIRSNATEPTATLPLVGTGQQAPPPRALSMPAALAFGSQRVGTVSAGVPLPISNNLASEVSITDIAVTGDYDVSQTCATIVPRGSCAPLVTFRPVAQGARAGSIVIHTLAEAQPYTVALSGTGMANPLPALIASVARMGFGNALIGSVAPLTFELRNVGQVAVAIQSIAPMGDFMATHACTSIAAGDSCEVRVLFMPRATGMRAGSLAVRSDAEERVIRIELSGVGCQIPGINRSRFGGLVCGP